jgi:hypothetical protein
MMEVQVRVVDRVLKPVADVFDAIVDPDKITKFFASGSSGPMAPGKTITWTFADVGRAISPHLGQTQGWTDFICCMKGYLRFGVNLREGRTREAH